MKIVVPREENSAEKRVALLPDTVHRLGKKGAELLIEKGLGLSLGISDEEYIKAGASVIDERPMLLQQADVVVKIRKLARNDISYLKKNTIYIGFVDPFFDKELLQLLANSEITTIAMEMIPRITRAQKMDALSSQASLAGYAAVIYAANSIQKIFPMMMTPAGTIQPARVFVIGAGVAGLQAIATAKRLGARVDAFDTRPTAKNDVLSLGAKFVEIDLGETGQTEQGYAKALTEEQLAKQRAEIKKYCIQSDVVITTAQIFGKRAPFIVTKEIIKEMKPGSIIIDLAVETGGNVEGIEPDTVTEVNGVLLVGLTNFQGRVAYNASQMYSQNIYNLIDEFWNQETKSLELRLNDEILRSAVVTHGGSIVHPKFIP